MTDELRASLVAIAVGRGLGSNEAWEIVERVEGDGKPLRELINEVYVAATAAVYPYS